MFLLINQISTKRLKLDKNLRPVLAGNSMKPVGSTALRQEIEKDSAFAWFYMDIFTKDAEHRVSEDTLY